MQFQVTDFPRILPELMLLVLALLVLSSDILERWSADPQGQAERTRASAQLTAIGLGLVFIVALVQSGYLFRIGPPQIDGGALNGITNIFGNLARNLQAAGPYGDLAIQPILGAFATDHLTMVARLTLIGAALLTTLLATDFRPSGNPGEFYALILFATAGMCIMAAASELILAFVALELASVALYILAGYFRNDPRSVEAGVKYFLFGALSSGVLLYGMSLAYGFTASSAVGRQGQAINTLFSEIGRASQGTGANTALLTLAMIFIVAGTGYKIGVAPFHAWSPDVYQGAPTPITGLISTTSKLAGFVLLYRLLTTAFPSLAGTPGSGLGGWTGLLALLALVTVLVGNLSALPQTNAKRLLAYSSIGQAGFILLALVLWSATPSDARSFGIATLLYYLVAYTITNIGAFGGLAVVAEALGGDEIADLNGLARRNIGLATMLTVLVLSLAGIPPLAGYFAKMFVFMAGYRAGAVWLVTVAVIMTIISLYYYLRLLKAMWISPPADETPIKTPRAMNATLIITTALVLLLGIVPSLLWNVLSQVAAASGR